MPPNDDLSRLPFRVSRLESDLQALDLRCRECSERTRSTLRIIAEELGRFGAHVAKDVAKINQRIDSFVCPATPVKRKRGSK